MKHQIISIFLLLNSILLLVSATILPPRLSTQQKELYLTEGQTEVVLDCNLDVGDDPITYRWLKHYRLVTAELGYAYRTLRNVHLALNEIARNHEGLYECEAANDAGVNAVSIYVHVQPNNSPRKNVGDQKSIDTHTVLSELAISLNDVLAEGDCECDIMFLLHASPDAPTETLALQANFVYTIAQTIISEQRRISVMIYSDYVNSKLSFASGTNLCALKNALKDLSHENWVTRIQPVLSSALKKMKKSTKQCKVIFLPIFHSLGLEGASETVSTQLQKMGVKLFILEVTNSPIEGVDKMASRRGDGKPYHWWIPLKIWPTIISYMKYMKDELTGCTDIPNEVTGGACVGNGSTCTQSSQCANIGFGCVQGICQSLNCNAKPAGPGCCAHEGDNFWCGDVTMDCKKGSIVCDGKSQCMNGLDEEDCWFAACPANMVRCQSSVLCLSLYELCDGEVHCPSAEDEDASFCRSHPCPVNRPFRCRSGKCISKEQLCDGMFKNCEDGDDENLSYCSSHHVCPATRPFKCDYGVCISEKKVCDGVYNCLDALDEKLCDERNCPIERPFKCSEGKCVEIDKICNGIMDACPDGSDEFNCTQFICPASRSYKCFNGRCIDKWLECDRRDDCGDNSDEESCKYTTSTSNSGVIGGATSPPPTTTESPTTEIKRPCLDDEFYCSRSTSTGDNCLNISLACNGRNDCENGEDEAEDYCEYHMCPPERPHHCADNICVSAILCNGMNECADGSDETGCGNVTVGATPADAMTEVEEVEPNPEPEGGNDKSSSVVETAGPAASSGKGTGSGATIPFSSCTLAIWVNIFMLSLSYTRWR